MELYQNQYYQQAAPKSLGQEWVEENVFPLRVKVANIDVEVKLKASIPSLFTWKVKFVEELEQNCSVVPGAGLIIWLLSSNLRS